jgi:protein involved in polysaccharide export with SLBB domain
MKRAPWALFPLVLLAFLSPAAGAQMQPRELDVRRDSVVMTGPRFSPTATQDAPIDPKTYVLGPGDQLVIETLGRASLTFPTEVDPEGNLWIPDFGSVHVAGLTLEQARAKLRQTFSRGLEVVARLTRMRRVKVYVAGEVGAPGIVETTPATRVSEAVQFAGGLLPSASRRNIRVDRGAGAPLVADLQRFERTGSWDANPLLREGDRVFVPPRLLTVGIHAPVPYPGEYEFRVGERVSDLVALAGGFEPTAVRERGLLLRFTSPQHSDSIAIDLTAPAGSSADLLLEEGDRLFVPALGSYHENRRATIVGLVNFPGDYPIRDGVDRVSDLIGRAGGFAPGARSNEVLLVRRSGTALDRDPEFDRLARLSRAEMTDGEYQAFRSKLASSQSTFLVDLRKDGDHGLNPEREARVDRDVLLQQGDLVIAERQSFVVRVAGEVRKPGLIEYQADRTGRDYVMLAGGFGARANRGGVRLTRSSTGQTTLLKDVNIVEPGDLIYVPDKKDKNWLAFVRDVLTIATAITTLIVVSKR